MSKKEKKEAYIDKLRALINKYGKIVFVNADNVNAKQLNTIRKDFRNYNNEILMGKNSLMKRAFKKCVESKPELAGCIKAIKGNVGLIFTNGDVTEIIDIVGKHVVPAEAKKGSIAPCDVWIEAGPTGLEPTKTSFFQSLQISTKITRGVVDILTRKKLITEGEIVGGSEANILNMIGVKPFTYGLKVAKIYENGALFDPSVLKMTDADLLGMINESIRNVAAVSMELGVYNEASMPHVLKNAVNNIFSVAVGLDFAYMFDEVKQIKEVLENPELFKAAAPAEEKKEEAAPEKAEEPEEEEESDEDMGLGLFGDDSDDD